MNLVRLLDLTFLRPTRGNTDRNVKSAALVVVAHLLVAIFTPAIGKGYADLIGWLQTFAMIAALTTLGIRVLEDGMGIRVDVARYRRYGGEVAELDERYKAAAEAGERLAVMERLEELSYRELRDFLTGHHDASFVL